MPSGSTLRSVLPFATLACVVLAPDSARPEPLPDEPPAPITTKAGLGEGVKFEAGDAFSLQLRARTQIQGAVSHPTPSAERAGAADDYTTEALVRRLRLVLSGHAFTTKLNYYIQLGFAARDLESDRPVPLRDAYLTWQPLRDLGVRLGQMKVPYGKQRVVSSSALQLVDRSIVTGEFSLDRDVGAYALSEDLFGWDGRLKYQAGVFGGQGRNRSGGRDAVMPAARIQVNPFGKFDDLVEGDLARSSQPRLALGASAAYNFNSDRTRSTHGGTLDAGDFDYGHLGADLLGKWRGLSLQSEYFFRRAEDPAVTVASGGASVTEFSRSGQGYYVQAGYVFPVPFEIAARFGQIFPYSGNAPEADFAEQNEIGGGASYYFSKHNLKVQGDYFRLYGDDSRAARDQVRVQVQLFL